MGGVQSGRDALELLAAGASAVALGTVLFADPDAPRRIRAELDAELVAFGLTRPEDAVALAHDPPQRPRRTLEHGLRVSN
jgi:dihydroorotate dehydrogenase (NAD+) catalytic subunit